MREHHVSHIPRISPVDNRNLSTCSCTHGENCLPQPRGPCQHFLPRKSTGTIRKPPTGPAGTSELSALLALVSAKGRLTSTDACFCNSAGRELSYAWTIVHVRSRTTYPWPREKPTRPQSPYTNTPKPLPMWRKTQFPQSFPHTWKTSTMSNAKATIPPTAQQVFIGTSNPAAEPGSGSSPNCTLALVQRCPDRNFPIKSHGNLNGGNISRRFSERLFNSLGSTDDRSANGSETFLRANIVASWQDNSRFSCRSFPQRPRTPPHSRPRRRCPPAKLSES